MVLPDGTGVVGVVGGVEPHPPGGGEGGAGIVEAAGRGVCCPETERVADRDGAGGRSERRERRCGG